MDIEIKYGKYKSEEHITHLWVRVRRDNCDFVGSFQLYPNSCNFKDVIKHTHADKGAVCNYSPTGFCDAYDEIKWTYFDTHISFDVARLILMERMNEALSKNGFEGIYGEEFTELFTNLRHLEIWEG